jgi:hypothetical protein
MLLAQLVLLLCAGAAHPARDTLLLGVGLAPLHKYYKYAILSITILMEGERFNAAVVRQYDGEVSLLIRETTNLLPGLLIRLAAVAKETMHRNLFQQASGNRVPTTENKSDYLRLQWDAKCLNPALI